MKSIKKYPPSVRIIAGKWRGRKILFDECNGIVRPTPDRVRETLFNWLSSYIVDAHCLDLYAGSGILSFEALSRNASNVVTVEQHPIVIQNIRTTAKLLQAELTLIHANVEHWLARIGQPYDIIFLDPPYSEQKLLHCFALLAQKQWTKPGSLIYYENNAAINTELLPDGWNVLKAKKAGQIYYYLTQVEKQ
jgi:16S rRNA (guanine966-N2)-methyltransferase